MCVLKLRILKKKNTTWILKTPTWRICFKTSPDLDLKNNPEEVDFKPLGPRAILLKPFHLADLKDKVDEVLGETS